MHKRTLIYTALFFLLVLFVVAFRLFTLQQFETRARAIRAAGFPVTLAELEKSYEEPPPGKNGADAYVQAFGLARRASDSIKIHFGSNEVYLASVGVRDFGGWHKLNTTDRENVDKFIAENERFLQALRRVPRFETCRYPVDYSGGLARDVSPYAVSARRCAQLLRVQIATQLEDRKPDAAAANVLMSLELARSLEGDPLLITQLIRMGIVGISVDDLERILNRFPLKENRLEELQRELREVEHNGKLALPLAGERCLYFDQFRNRSVAELIDTAPEHAPDRFVFLMARRFGIVDAGLASYSDGVDECIKVSNIPEPWNRISAAKALATSIKARPKYDLLAKLAVKSIDRLIEREVRIQACIDCASVAVAVERFRGRNGRLPQHLEEMVPDFLPGVPLDPFDGKPLRYIQIDQGYVVYSVGEDLRDNGGDVPLREDRKDISFQVGLTPEGLEPLPVKEEQPDWTKRRGRRRARLSEEPPLAPGSPTNASPASGRRPRPASH